MERESFIFYRSFFEAIDGLPTENQAHIYKAISCYALNGEIIELDVWENAVFKTIKSQIDANNIKFTNGCKGGEYGKLGAEYGKRGGRPRKKESNQNPPDNEIKNPPKTPQEPPKNPRNVNDNVNVNENVNDNKHALQACNSAHACTREEIPDKAKEEFFKAFPSVKLNGADDSGIDYAALLKAFLEGNAYLQNTKSMNYVTDHYAEIIGGGYRKTDKPQEPTPQRSKGDLQLWQELAKAIKAAKEERYCETTNCYSPIYLRLDKAADEEMKALYRGLSSEIMAYFDPQSFLELCSMSDDDLKYERARFLKHLSGS